MSNLINLQEDEVEEKYEEDPLIELSDEEVGFEATSQKPDLSKKQDDSNAAMHFVSYRGITVRLTILLYISKVINLSFMFS